MAHAPKESPGIINGRAVRDLVEAKEIRSALVLGQPGGFAVVVRYGSQERAVAAQRSRRVRLWRNLNTAAAYVRDELGMQRFEIDMAQHDPSALDRARPDTAERQRQLREAAEHDAWFRAQVQEALDGIKDGTNRAIEEAEWDDWFSEQIASLERRIANDGR
jgi:asparagine synthetase A